MIDTNVELRRAMISSALNRHPDAYGFVINHNYQDGPVITIASRSPRECGTLHGGMCDALRCKVDTVMEHDGEGFYFSGSRLKDDLKAIGLYVAGVIPIDENGEVRIYVDYMESPYFIRGKGTKLMVNKFPNSSVSTEIFRGILSSLINVDYVNISEKDLYPELLLANGAVRSSEHGVCQVATGEYVTQTVCTDCGNKTGVCRASENFDGIFELRSNSDWCEGCALKHFDCSSCDNFYCCDRKKTPADCEEFTLIDLDCEDDSLCSCPLGGDGE